jgi:hypothetical protein
MRWQGAGRSLSHIVLGSSAPLLESDGSGHRCISGGFQPWCRVAPRQSGAR